MPDFSHISIEATLKELDTSEDGLSNSSVDIRLNKFGKNQLVTKNRWGWLKICLIHS